MTLIIPRGISAFGLANSRAMHVTALRVGSQAASLRLLRHSHVASKACRVTAQAQSHTGPTIEEIVNVCKRRGIIFQSSDLYGGFSGFYDYGPLGVELRANIRKAWWRDMVHRREDVVGLDSSIICSPSVWEASGHIEGFSDPMVDCKSSKRRYRADQLFWSRAEVRSCRGAPGGSFGCGQGQV